MKLRQIASAVVGLGFLAALVVVFEQRIGWEHALALLAAVPATMLAGAVVLFLVSFTARAIRIHWVTAAHTRGQFPATVRLSCLCVTANTLLPARSGEILFPVLMRRHFGLPMGEGFAVLIWLRLFDLHCLFGAGLFGLALGMAGPVTAVLASVVWLALVPAGFVVSRLLAERLPRGSRITRWISDLLASAPRAWVGLYAWTWLTWYTKFAALAVLLMTMAGLTVDAAAAGIVAGELSFVLPMHGVAGAGTYQGAIVAVTALWSADADQVLAAAVDLHLFILGVTLVVAAASLLLPAGQPAMRSGMAEVR